MAGHFMKISSLFQAWYSAAAGNGSRESRKLVNSVAKNIHFSGDFAVLFISVGSPRILVALPHHISLPGPPRVGKELLMPGGIH